MLAEWFLVLYIGYTRDGGAVQIPMQSLASCLAGKQNAEKKSHYIRKKGSFCINTKTGEVVTSHDR